jgi:CIC family chloride channel protein
VVPVKFVGGVLAIGSGGALGREGPTVQMGAALGTFWARLFLRNAPDQSVINAAGAGAGLAVAFNAPIGASVFVIEELTRRVTPRLLIATLVASAIAVAEMRALLGNAPDFLVARGAATPISSLPYFLVAGALLGLLGTAYNATIVRFLDLFKWVQRLPAVVPAAMVGLVVGLLAWFAPSFVGGGDFLSQTIIWNGLGLSSLAMVLIVRFFLGPLSYAPGMPGGLFAPLLLVGAAASALLAGSVNAIWPATLPITDFAVVGMAAFFTAVVRTPFTGIMLVAEMTERADLALPLLVASLGAILISTALGSEPIYDTLRARMPANDRLKHEAKLS